MHLRVLFSMWCWVSSGPFVVMTNFPNRDSQGADHRQVRGDGAHRTYTAYVAIGKRFGNFNMDDILEALR